MRDEIILSVPRMNARLQERQGSAGCIVKCDRVSIASEHARSSPLFRYKTGSASPIVNGTMWWIIARNMRSRFPLGGRLAGDVLNEILI